MKGNWEKWNVKKLISWTTNEMGEASRSLVYILLVSFAIL